MQALRVLDRQRPHNGLRLLRQARRLQAGVPDLRPLHRQGRAAREEGGQAMTREEAIEVYHGLINTKIKEAFEFFAPELRESEDEKTRKEIIEFIRSQIEDGNSVGWDRWIAWLEKQKEQKPRLIGEDSVEKMARQMCETGQTIEQKPSWSEEDKMIEKNLQEIENATWEIRHRLKSLRPQPHWKPSEEQMKALIDCTIGNEYDVHTLVRLWAELKKL